MDLAWSHESDPRWDDDKRRILGAAQGALPEFPQAHGDSLPGEWWRVEAGSLVVGYGWMDQTWNGAEILLAVDPEARRQGVGTRILDELEHEASQRGLNYLYNVVRATHPDRAGVTRWLESRGFHGREDGELGRRVGSS